MELTLWPDLEGRRILLGVSGGIAAYKAVELCRLFVRCGAAVQVVMTRAAREFIGEATFAALTGRPVGTSLWDPTQEATIGHIAAADEAELFVVAPCTANFLATMAQGLAPDLASTIYLAFDGPVLVAPAMNVRMWAHPATQQNAETLRSRGHRLVGPGAGELACGHVGAGRMVEPEVLLQAAGACLATQDMAGRKILVTAGGTREAIDPVRFIGNLSTGKMGFALAAEALARGAEVTLVAGPTHVAAPWNVEVIAIESAAEMAAAVDERVATQDAVIMAAAVADFSPRVAPGDEKLKKEALSEGMDLKLGRTRDILKTLGARFAGDDTGPLLVGFAAETAHGDAARLVAIAETKRVRKGCHLLVANDVSVEDAGFASDTNRVVIVEADRDPEAIPVAAKRCVAAQILDRVASHLDVRLTTRDGEGEEMA
ncbi:MAG: bifunctional phosphopantothenoylcysteine decarboxylase/phosphopantothenate--cysteine ligase CoaBC [Deltaproteobacteria bacterium]|nr:bifunctional phosphopantothenoylcysteine decarboxylase/phosphopantothenate--cysteine ligase CoaBC [Deltaproteobacteria bacterium]